MDGLGITWNRKEHLRHPRAKGEAMARVHPLPTLHPCLNPPTTMSSKHSQFFTWIVSQLCFDFPMNYDNLVLRLHLVCQLYNNM